jgi:hypothetical protein
MQRRQFSALIGYVASATRHRISTATSAQLRLHCYICTATSAQLHLPRDIASDRESIDPYYTVCPSIDTGSMHYADLDTYSNVWQYTYSTNIGHCWQCPTRLRATHCTRRYTACCWLMRSCTPTMRGTSSPYHALKTVHMDTALASTNR